MRLAVSLAVVATTAVAIPMGCGDAFTESPGGGDDGGESGADVGSNGDAQPDGDEASGDDVRDDFVLDVLDDPPPTCGGDFACVPAAPQGWTGPLEYYEGGSANPACSTHYVGPLYTGNRGLSTASGSCGCKCNAPAGATCQLDVTFYNDPTSCNSPCPPHALSGGVCTTVDPHSGCGGGEAARPPYDTTAPVASGGSCPPDPAHNFPTPAWSTNGEACESGVALHQVDCGANQVCAPTSESPFGPTLCIQQAGDVACPGVDYTVKHTLYGGFDDTRACTACTCGAPSGVTCSGALSIYNSQNTTCAGLASNNAVPVFCTGLGPQGAQDFQLNASPSGGSCVPSTVSLTGGVDVAKPMTFCCAP
jgi:hypothetical protein